MKLTSSFIITVFFLSCIISVYSCKSSGGAAPEEVIFYYPQKNIYYDNQRANYYYSLNGGATWDSMAFTGSTFGEALGPRVSIPKTNDSSWLDNVAHRKQYHGVALNIINDYTIALSKADRVNKLKAIVKAQTQPVVVEEQKQTAEEKGLKKLFHKIFGKKKKPTEDKEQ